MYLFCKYSISLIFCVNVYLILMICSYTSSELIHYYLCGIKNSCTISNVRITPCPEALENEACNLYRGINSTLTFDYVPTFNASTMTGQSYSRTFLLDIPNPDHDRDLCKYTTCPVEAGKKYTVNYTSYVKESYPIGPYFVKWNIWGSYTDECCFFFHITIL